MSGVGSLVLTKAAKPATKKAPKKKQASGEHAGPDDEPAEPSASTSGKKKAKGKKASDSPAAAAASPLKRGGSSVDPSKPLSAWEERHEAYMGETVDKLRQILNLNMIGAPQDKKKNALAWQCCYGEILGAPLGNCPRCLRGKLKPKLKKEQYGQKIKKGDVKWVCGGYFDDEEDKIKFCNRTYPTDGNEIATRPFRGLGVFSDADAEELAARKALERAEREEARLEREDGGASDVGSEGEPSAAHGKRKFGHAPRLATSDEIPADVAALLANPHSRLSSAAPNAPHVKKEGFDLDSFKQEKQVHEMDTSRGGEKPAKKAKTDSSSRPGAAAASSSSEKPLCQYDPDCYRTSAAHLQEYRHTKPTAAAAASSSGGGDAESKEAEGEEEEDGGDGEMKVEPVNAADFM